MAKSVEVNAAIGLLAGLIALRSCTPAFFEQWKALAAEHFARASTFELTVRSAQEEFLFVGEAFLRLVLPILLVVIIAALVSNFLQVGFIMSSQPLTPDFARLNPFQGIARMFSGRSMVELLKSMIKAQVIGYLVYAFLRERGPEVVALSELDHAQIGPAILGLCMDLLMKTTIAILVIAAADYMYQRWQFEKGLRMTKQEIKEEYKRQEGDPLIKARTRQRQREMARNRMMADAQKATVVITNPTHYAVALRYAPEENPAPIVVAKGQRLVAQKIKEIAREHNIPIIENKPVARALFDACEMGDAIPNELYQAVAEIIAFVYRQSGRVPH